MSTGEKPNILSKNFHVAQNILDEGLNFKNYSFRIADVSNLETNNCSNVERPNLRVI